MEYIDLFLGIELPRPLSQEKLYDYFKKYKQGDKSARKAIIKHNIRLVINEVLKKFSNTPYDEDDLVSIGLIGLIKSIDTFDTSKKIQFSSYSTKCIDNEILMFLKKEKKHLTNYSLNNSLTTDKDGKKIRIEDTLYDENQDFISDCEIKESYAIIHRIIENLPYQDKEIIKLYFGFRNYTSLTQKQIADKLNITQSYTSKIIKRVLRKLNTELRSDDRIKAIINDRNPNKLLNKEKNCKKHL